MEINVNIWDELNKIGLNHYNTYAYVEFIDFKEMEKSISEYLENDKLALENDISEIFRKYVLLSIKNIFEHEYQQFLQLYQQLNQVEIQTKLNFFMSEKKYPHLVGNSQLAAFHYNRHELEMEIKLKLDLEGQGKEQGQRQRLDITSCIAEYLNSEKIKSMILENLYQIINDSDEYQKDNLVEVKLELINLMKNNSISLNIYSES